MKKKLISLLLAVIMCLSVFAGCSSEPAQPSVSEADAATSAPEPSKSPETVASPSPAETQEEPSQEQTPTSQDDTAPDTQASAAPVVYELPLTDTPVTYDLWSMSAPPFISAYLGSGESYSTAEATLYVAEQTGVVLNYIGINMMAYSEQFNLMIIAGDYPDMVSGLAEQYAGGAEKALIEDIIIDLTDYVTNSMPAYMQVIEKTGVKKELLNDKSQYLTISGISNESSSDRGGTVRKDWLDALGMDIPVTYDDWYNIGIAFINNYDLDMAFYFSSTLNPSVTLSSGYDLPAFDLTASGSHFYQINGQVQSALVQQEMKDYLTMLSKWYADGLISKDFYTMAGPDVRNYFTASKCGGCWDNADFITENNSNAELMATGYSSAGAPITVKEEGQIVHFSPAMDAQVGTNGLCITTGCENIDLLITFLDYMFTEQGQLLNNYGMEGLSYEMTTDGNILWTDAVANNTEGLTFKQASATYILSALPSLFDIHRYESVTFDTASYEAVELWNTGYDEAYDLPTSLYFTDDEASVYSNFIADIETLATEYMLKCVTGENDIEATWEGYVAEIWSLNLQQCIDVKQNAFERYNQRGN